MSNAPIPPPPPPHPVAPAKSRARVLRNGIAMFFFIVALFFLIPSIIYLITEPDYSQLDSDDRRRKGASGLVAALGTIAGCVFAVIGLIIYPWLRKKTDATTRLWQRPSY